MAKSQTSSLFPENSYPPHSMRHSTACRLLETGVDLVIIKNILGHVSVQTTQLHGEISQDTVDKKLKEWNETWFGDNQKINVKKATDNIPYFLKKK